MDKNLNIIGNLRRLMRHARMNISEAARAAGVERVSLSRALSNKTEPRDETLAKLADAFDVTVEYLENDPLKNELPELKKYRKNVYTVTVDRKEKSAQEQLRELEENADWEEFRKRRDVEREKLLEALIKSTSHARMVDEMISNWEKSKNLIREAVGEIDWSLLLTPKEFYQKFLDEKNGLQKKSPRIPEERQELIDLILKLNDVEFGIARDKIMETVAAGLVATSANKDKPGL